MAPRRARGEIVLGGFIDRLHQDTDGRWHILDFKTNDVTRGQLADVAAPYEMQLFVYALAAEQILKTSPASLTLDFLRTGDEHAFAWNAAARRRSHRQSERSHRPVAGVCDPECLERGSPAS